MMVFAVEVVVGAAFWAFAHIRMDGQEFANDQQSHGYSILLNCIFRPLLTVIGLIFSSVIMCVMAQFVDNTFVQAKDNSLGSVYDPFALIAVILLLFWVHYQVCSRSLRIITMLPNAVIAWCGNRATGGDYGGVSDAEEASQKFVGVVSTGGGAAAKSVQARDAQKKEAAAEKAKQEAADKRKAAGTQGGGGEKPDNIQG